MMYGIETMFIKALNQSSIVTSTKSPDNSAKAKVNQRSSTDNKRCTTQPEKYATTRRSSKLLLTWSQARETTLLSGRQSCPKASSEGEKAESLGSYRNVHPSTHPFAH